MNSILKTLGVFLVLAVIFPLIALAEEKQEPTNILAGPITLAQALQMALLQNPGLQAFSYEVRAREAQALQAGLVSNPRLNVEVENVGGSGNFNNFDQSETTVQLSQLVELGGKRHLRKNSADLSKELAGWDYEVKRLEVLARVSQSYIHVLKAQQLIALADERVQLAQKFLDAVVERIQAGKVAAIEKIKMEVALANMQIEEEQAKLELENARRKLSVLWGETEPKFDSAQGDLFSVPDKVLKTIPTLSANPRLSKWSTALSHRQAELDVENSKTIPDLTLSGGFRRLEETGDNTMIFGVTVPLQWFNRNQGSIAKAQHRLSKTQEEKKAETLKMKETLMQAYGEVSFSHAKVISIKTEVLPGARKALNAISEGYRFGKFSLLDVLDSQKTFFQVRSQYLDALVNYHNAVTDVERLAGVDPVTRKNPTELGKGGN
ncbi:MAG: TolC family protein [Nitrospina sp.]|jgi:outer membrane protein, heavy metal efflux system|nr:TolC family protein [Nitrospina sp.]